MTCAFDCRCQACRIEHFTRPTPELDAWLRDPATTADPRDMTIAYLRAEVARLTAERDARPAITREDARAFVDSDYPLMDNATSIRVFAALREHAKGGE